MSPGSPGIGFGGIQNPFSSIGTSSRAPKSLIGFFSLFRIGTAEDGHFSETQPGPRVGIVVVGAELVVVVDATVVAGATVVVETTVVVEDNVVVEAIVVVGTALVVVVSATVVVGVTVVAGITSAVVESTSEDPPQAEASKRKQKTTPNFFIELSFSYLIKTIKSKLFSN